MISKSRHSAEMPHTEGFPMFRKLTITGVIVLTTVAALPIYAMGEEPDHHHCLSQMRRGVTQSAECIKAGYKSSSTVTSPAPIAPVDKKPKKPSS
jgi:hypothetical protein